MTVLHPAIFDLQRLNAVRATGLLDTDPEEDFDRLTRVASAVLDAPYAFITLVDDVRSFWKSRVGENLVASENLVEESFCQYVVASDEKLIIDDAAHDERTKENPSIESMGVAAWAGFPIHAPGGEVLGTFCVVDLKKRTWTQHDVEVLEALSEAASGEIALRDALRRSEQQSLELIKANEEMSSLASTLQESLLPPNLPEIPGAEIAARYLPAGHGQVLGDFYDAFRLTDTSWGLLLGDVSGKGVAAAKVATLARYTVRAASAHTTNPREILGELNAALIAQKPHGDGGFLTAVFVALEPQKNGWKATICSGGHAAPMIRRQDGSIASATRSGTLLGLFDDAALHNETVDLKSGDLLLMYSDGVTEARNSGKFFGEVRLADILMSQRNATAHETTLAVEQAVEDFASGQRVDDVALLSFRALPE